MPPGFLYDHGLETSSRSSTRPVSTRKQNAATVASCLREMATRIEEHPELLDIAADAMALDLQKSRLAPLGDELPPPGPWPGSPTLAAHFKTSLCTFPSPVLHDAPLMQGPSRRRTARWLLGAGRGPLGLSQLQMGKG